MRWWKHISEKKKKEKKKINEINNYWMHAAIQKKLA